MSAARLEESAAFPFIEVSGTPRNAGLQYGRKAAARIHRSIEIYRGVFAAKDVDWGQARIAAARFAARIDQAYPRIAEEMRAIAQGAEVPFEDIVAIWTGIIYWRDGTKPSWWTKGPLTALRVFAVAALLLVGTFPLGCGALPRAERRSARFHRVLPHRI